MDYEDAMSFMDRERGGDGVRPLVIGPDFYEGFDDMDEAHEVANLMMEKSMMERGLLCPAAASRETTTKRSTKMSEIHVDGYEKVEVVESAVGAEIYIDDELVLDLYDSERVELIATLRKADDDADLSDLVDLTDLPIDSRYRVRVQPIIPVPVDEDEARGYVGRFIDAEVPMFVKYTKEDGERVYRTISPYEVRQVQRPGRSTWNRLSQRDYVVGWDHLRQAVRNFRIERIEAICPAQALYRPENG